MIHTTLLKNESYLAFTTIISVGVLSGCEYCSPVLAILLVTPVIKLLIKKIFSNHRSVINHFIFK
jgi:hypothetical protein